jgi:SAM-dependent methyltransferase
MNEQHRPEPYWSERLEGEFSLKGTGHIGYSRAYNRWLYRAKGRALRRALKGVDLPARTLDIGSGTGWVVRELLQFGASVEGSDLTAVAVERLREAFPGITFHCFAIGSDQVPYGEASLDLVTALDVLYHVTDDQAWSAAIKEIARVLRPGGALIVTDGMAAGDQDPAHHVRFRSLDRWRHQAESSGMQLSDLVPLYRWLSRDPSDGRLASLPDSVRGPLEYGLETLKLGRPHMWCGVLTRASA